MGKHLVRALLRLDPEALVLVLTRPASVARFAAQRGAWFGPECGRVHAVAGDITRPLCGLGPEAVTALLAADGGVAHFFHLAASYDMAAGDAENEAANVTGTAHAVALANRLGPRSVFHYTSSIAVAGDHRGIFFEGSFQEGQQHAHAYMRTKFEAEALVRRECSGPYRIYRPGIVIGSSADGEAEKIDGPYYVRAPPLCLSLSSCLAQVCPVCVTCVTCVACFACFACVACGVCVLVCARV